MKVNAVSRDAQIKVQMRQTTETQQYSKKLDDEMKTVKKGHVAASQLKLYQQKLGTVWLIEHSRIGGNIDKIA
jgi:hypothetical protein